LISQISPIHFEGGTIDKETRGECLTAHQRNEIKTRLSIKISEIKNDKKQISKISSSVSFRWPLRMIPNQQFQSCFTIYNYVDQDLSVGPNSWNQFSTSNLDYNCGNRTYDTNSGYNHLGIDFGLWPFEWYMYENDIVEVVAAEAGTIIDIDDGNFDMNCSCIGNWNAIYIMHADGSVAWYGHIKQNSFTSKTAGQSVNKGEFLGIVASSGCSTDPHLHFEVYDASDNLIDPYAGPCNSMNSSSWWSNQEPYINSTMNALLTHSAPPVFGCTSSEQPNFSNCFNPGQTIYTAMYYRDQQVGDITDMRLRRPDGSIWNSWNHSSPNSYPSSYWYWSWILPPTGPYGSWTLEADYQGKTSTYEFSYTDQPCTCPLSYAHSNGNNLSGTLIWNADFESFGWIESNQTIGANADVIYDSGTLICLDSGFETLVGAEFEAIIDGCGGL